MACLSHDLNPSQPGRSQVYQGFGEKVATERQSDSANDRCSAVSLPVLSGSVSVESLLLKAAIDSPQQVMETLLQVVCRGPWGSGSSCELPGREVERKETLGELQRCEGEESWNGAGRRQFGAIANAVHAIIGSTLTEDPHMAASLVLDASLEGPENDVICRGRKGKGGRVVIRSRSWMDGMLSRMATGHVSEPEGR